MGEQIRAVFSRFRKGLEELKESCRAGIEMEFQISSYLGPNQSPDAQEIRRIYEENKDSPVRFLEELVDFFKGGNVQDEAMFFAGLTLVFLPQWNDIGFQLAQQYSERFPSMMINTQEYFQGNDINFDQYIEAVKQAKSHALEIGSPRLFVFITLNSMVRLLRFGKFEEIVMTFESLQDFAQKHKEQDITLVSLAKRCLWSAGWASYFMGDYERALERSEELISLAREEQDPFFEGHALVAKGAASSPLCRWQDSLESNERAIPLKEAVGDTAGLAATLNNTAGSLMILGRYTEAEKYLLEALEIREKTGLNAWQILHNLGELCLFLGKLNEARSFAEKAYALLPRRGIPSPSVSDLLARILIEEENLDHVGKYLEELRTWSEARGSKSETAQYHLCRGLFEEKRGNLSEAEEAFSTALYIADSLGVIDIIVRCRVSLAEVLVARFRITQKKEYLHQSLEELQLAEVLCNEANLEALSTEIKLLQGIIAILDERYEEAKEVLERGLQESRRSGYPLTKDFENYLQEARHRSPTEKVKESIFRRIIRGIRRVLNWQAPSTPSRVPVKILGCIIISRRHATPVFSHLEEGRFRFDSVLMGGLITAVEMFTSSLAKEERGRLQSIIHEQIVILLEHDESFVYAILSDKSAYVARALAKRLASMFSEKYDHIVRNPTWNHDVSQFEGADELFTEALTSMQLA